MWWRPLDVLIFGWFDTDISLKDSELVYTIYDTSVTCVIVSLTLFCGDIMLGFTYNQQVLHR